MSIADSIVPGLPEVAAIIEDDTLVRLFHQNVFSPQIWRSEATESMKVPANYGVSQTHTRSGRMTVDDTPRTAGVDPVPKNLGTEQWVHKVQPYNDSIDINLTVDDVALASTFMQRVEGLGLNAGETINRLPRNTLFNAYGTGHALVDVGGAPTTTVTVNSIAGFTHQLGADGVLAPVSASNPKQWYLNPTAGSTPQAATIIGAVAADPNTAPYGRGTLTLSAATFVAAHDVIRAYDAPAIVRAGNGTSVDSITPANTLRLIDLRRASSYLSDNSIPKHRDGYYHAHIPAVVTAQVFNDSELQALNDGRFGDAPYRNMMLGTMFNCVFIENPEVPRVGDPSNVGTLQTSRPTNAPLARVAPRIGIEMINRSGIPIMRVIITGGGALIEVYTDRYPRISEAGWAGVMTGFKPIVSGNIQANTMGIKLILRAPQDRLGQMVAASWAWGGDFTCPSDALGGIGRARFKRAIVIECADTTLLN